MLWSHGKPHRREQRVIGFLDVDNLLIQEDRPFCPSAWSVNGMNKQWMEWTLDNALVVLRNIGEQVELRLFVDMDSRHRNAAREDIREAAEERGITLVHVPAKEGKDQVDAALIADWEQAHQETDLSVPFVLFSEDVGYTPMLCATRPQRSVYLFLPVNHFYPQHVRFVNGWGWLDKDASRNRALSFLLNEEAPMPAAHFLSQLLGLSKDAHDWWIDGQRALEAIGHTPDLSCKTEEECIAFLGVHGIEAERAGILLWYLIRYGVLMLHSAQIVPNIGYQRRTFPLSSVA